MAQSASEKGALTDRTRTLQLASSQVVLAPKVIWLKSVVQIFIIADLFLFAFATFCGLLPARSWHLIPHLIIIMVIIGSSCLLCLWLLLLIFGFLLHVVISIVQIIFAFFLHIVSSLLIILISSSVELDENPSYSDYSKSYTQPYLLQWRRRWLIQSLIVAILIRLSHKMNCFPTALPK